MLDEYLQQLTTRLQKELEGQLVGLYLCGSVELGDFSQQESDLDLIAVCKNRLKQSAIHRLSNTLSHDSLACPAAGIELFLIKEKLATSPVRYPAYEMLMRTGGTWELQVSSHQIETDLLIDLAICRQKGRVIRGRPPSELIPEIPRNWLIHAMYQSLHWRQKNILHPFYDPQGENAVLNACRAWYYQVENRFCSKTEAGQWAMQHLEHAADRELIKQALDIRWGRRKKSLDRHAIGGFVKKIKSSLYKNWFYRLLDWFG